MEESSHGSDGSNRNNGDSKRDYDEEISYSSGEPAPKRLKKTDKETLGDRLSALPDSLLLHILSLLPMKEVVQTSTLSKKWQHLWTCVDNLTFIYDDLWSNRFEKFISFVNKTLILCSCSKITKFAVRFDYDICLDSDVDSWIRFASKNKVEDLNLNFVGLQSFHGKDSYSLPQHLYSNSSLTKLKLSLCVLEPSGVISWGSLKNLSLRYVVLSEDVIERILSGCPLLEVLELCDFCGLRRLDVTSSPNVRTLKLKGLLGSDDDWLEISAPNLLSLEISGNLYKKCRLVKVSSLVDANLSFALYTLTDDYEEHRNMLLKLLESLGHVKELTIGNWCTQVLSILDVKGLPSPLLKCKCLTLDTHMENWDLPGIANLLQSSPSLETLVIDMPSDYTTRCHFSTEFADSYIFNGEDYLTSQKRNFVCLSQHLKNVKIVDFGKRHSIFELKLVQFLLEKARVLEKMVIKSEWKRGDQYFGFECCMSQELLKLAQQLLSFPRSSPTAIVVFSESC